MDYPFIKITHDAISKIFKSYTTSLESDMHDLIAHIFSLRKNPNQQGIILAQ